MNQQSVRHLYKSNVFFSKRENMLFSRYFLYIAEHMEKRPAVTLFLTSFLSILFSYFFNVLSAVMVSVLFILFSIWSARLISDKITTKKNQIPFILVISSVIAIFLSVRMGIERENAHSFFSFQKASVQEDSLSLLVSFFLNGRFFGMSESVRVQGEKGIILTVNTNDVTGFSHGTIRLSNGSRVAFSTRLRGFSAGSSVVFSGSLYTPEKKRNPGGFDARDYYGRKGIFYQLDIKDWEEDFSEAYIFSWFYRFIEEGKKIGRRLSLLWYEVLPEKEAALLSGMMTGDTSGMKSRERDMFSMSNLSHLTAVSGANISFFLLPASAAFYKLSSSKRGRKAFLLSFLFLLGFLTGWSSSVLRAVFAAGGAVIYSIFKKRSDPINILFFTGFLLFLFSPYLALDIGFQLSFSASLGLFLFSRPLEKVLSEKVPFLPTLLLQAFAGTLSAMFGMLPFLFFLRSKQSLFLFVINVFAVLLSEAISVLCFPLTALYAPFYIMGISSSFFQILFAPIYGLLWLLEMVAQKGMEGSYSASLLSHIPIPFFLMAVFLFLWTIFPEGFIRKKMKVFVLAFLLIGILVSLFPLQREPDFTVVFSDVGQGDCILLMNQKGKSVLIDGGKSGAGRTVLSPLLDYYGIEKPDITILTHMDSDHAEGILELIEMKRIDRVYTGFSGEYLDERKTEKNPLWDLAQSGELEIVTLQQNDTITLDSTFQLTVLWPLEKERASENEDSLVLLAELMDTGILFTGDIGEKTESILLSDERVASLLKEKVDFLKIGHHGSRFSTSEKLLNQMNIDAAFFCVGTNQYGHPSQEVMTRLEERDILFFRTDISGAILLKGFGEQMEIVEYAA